MWSLSRAAMMLRASVNAPSFDRLVISSSTALAEEEISSLQLLRLESLSFPGRKDDCYIEVTPTTTIAKQTIKAPILKSKEFIKKQELYRSCDNEK